MPKPSGQTFLWFDTEAEAAARFYCSLFDDAQITRIFPQFLPDGSKGGAFIVEFTLLGQSYAAMNGGPHYRLNPAVSISVHVDTQDEVDRLWNALLANGGIESRCGWLTDRFGLSWQIVPRALLTYLQDPDREKSGRVMQAMMQMVKLDIAAMDAAAKG